MPEEGAGRGHVPREELEDDWRAAVILLGSMKDAELLDPTLSPLQLLHTAPTAPSSPVWCKSARSPRSAGVPERKARGFLHLFR